MKTGLHLVDTHCHLTLDQFQSDRAAVLERARNADISTIVIPGIDLRSSQRAVELAEASDGLFAAVGFHPHAAESWDSASKAHLMDLAQSDYVVAIGEIGLDYYHQYSPIELQKSVLSEQLNLAAELSLPVILHNRESLHDLLPIITQWRDGLSDSHRDIAGVLHAFSGNLEQARRATANGFYLGIGGPITFKNADDHRRITRKLSLDRILVETDAPYLTPHPHRGKRNEPAFTRLVAERLAGLFEIELATLAEITTKNATQLFGWSNGLNNGNIL